MDHVSHGRERQRIEHAVADQLARRLRHEVVPIVGTLESGDLLSKSLVRQLGRLRNEKPWCCRDGSFGLGKEMRFINARCPDGEVG